MTAEFEHRSTVNKRYEPPSEEVRAAFDKIVYFISNGSESERDLALIVLRALDDMDEHMPRALMYHARNGGLA